MFGLEPVVGGPHGADGAHGGAVGPDGAEEGRGDDLGEGLAILARDEVLGPPLGDQVQDLHLHLGPPVGQQEVLVVRNLEKAQIMGIC